jgi:hypothetical protein
MNGQTIHRYFAHTKERGILLAISAEFESAKSRNPLGRRSRAASAVGTFETWRLH